MTVEIAVARPTGVRAVPLLAEPDLGHYPEFSRFFARTFGLDADPFAPPPVVRIDGRHYELVFIGRSGRAFPAGLELNALVPGLEPLDTARADRDLLRLLRWLMDGVGPPWSAAGFDQTASIFRIAALDDGA